jgi:hypothetical protein
MRELLAKTKRVIERNMTTILAGFVIFYVLLFVPQIRTIWLQLPLQMFAKGQPFGDTMLGVGFLLLVAFLIVAYTAAWYAVIPTKFLILNGLPTCAAPPAASLGRAGALWRRPRVAWLFAPVLFVAAVPNWLARKLSQRGRWWVAAGLAALALANFVARHALDRPTPDAQRLVPYPLAGATCSLFGWLLVPWVLWWAGTAVRRGNPRRPVGRTLTMLGRILALLSVTTFVGEMLWIGADRLPDVLSYRLYSIWAVFHLAFGVAVVALTLDVFHWRFAWPVRPLALAAGVLLLVFCPDFLPSFQPTSGSKDALAEQSADPPAQPDWYDHLYHRILETDERAPVVLVASSGGGSRAALFTALVLEALANEPLTDSTGTPYRRGGSNLRWGDQIVLMSSVSGGSLADGYYARRLTRGEREVHRAKIRNSFLTALADRTESTYGEVFKTYYEPLWERYAREAETSPDDDTKEWGKDIAPAPGRQVSPASDQNFRGRYLESAFADDMCTDFMAPLGRGLMTPELERGRSLAVFWDQRFGWGGVTNRQGFGAAKPRPPLLLFNATDVRQGRRLVVGFPPLYPNTFSPKQPSHPLADAKVDDTLALEDFAPAFELRLSEAVRLSANFPWGVPPARLTRTVRPLRQKLTPAQLAEVRARLTPQEGPSLRMFATGDLTRDGGVLTYLYPEESGRAKRLPDGGSDAGLAADLNLLVLWLEPLRFDTRLSPEFRGWANGVLYRLDRDGFLDRTTERELVLDGGVNDNTGIPTVCEVLEHLQRVAAQYDAALRPFHRPDESLVAARADRAWRILRELRRRGVVLVEIDSGAKPSPDPTRLLSAVRVPIQGLENAAYSTAGGAKDQYLARIQEAVRPRFNRAAGEVPQQYADDLNNSDRIVSASPAYHLTFVCNHSTDDDVMTAWALPPSDKAKIFATFYCELREWQEVKQPWFRRTWQRAWEFRKDHPPAAEQLADDAVQWYLGSDAPLDPAPWKKPDLPADTPAPSGGGVKPVVPALPDLEREKRRLFQQSKK